MSTATDTMVHEIISPIDGELVDRVTYNSPEDLNELVEKGKKAFESWSELTIKQRVQVFFNYRELLVKNHDSLSHLVHRENGKTLGEAKAEIDKAIEITEFACSLPQIAVGEVLEVSRGIQCRISNEPLGVVACITPFNFPSMVPHWTIPIALTLGNAMILKPSEKVPLSMIRTKELLEEAGLPKDLFQIIIGEKEIVEAICDHDGIEAVSFVGSTKVAQIVYQRASANLKRALCLGGAKNHLLVLPDANEEMTANNVVASMSGCAGQRCMAASAMVGVGAIDHIVAKICEDARKIVPGDNLGAVISQEAVERIEGYITEAEQQGAKILVDGRGASVPGKENGFYVGPTVIDYVTPDMKIAKEEVFGPVLSILRTKNLDDALDIQNNSNYGNGASVYTSSGGLSGLVAHKLKAGMIGVNIGVPVPREPFSFGGWDDSKFGVGDITGKSSIAFWTKLKKITTKWNKEDQVDWMS